MVATGSITAEAAAARSERCASREHHEVKRALDVALALSADRVGRLRCTEPSSLLPERTLVALVPRRPPGLWRKHGMMAGPEHVIDLRAGGTEIIGYDSKPSPLACPGNSPKGVRCHLDLPCLLRQVECHSRETGLAYSERGSRLPAAPERCRRCGRSLTARCVAGTCLSPRFPTARFSQDRSADRTVTSLLGVVDQVHECRSQVECHLRACDFGRCPTSGTCSARRISLRTGEDSVRTRWSTRCTASDRLLRDGRPSRP